MIYTGLPKWSAFVTPETIFCVRMCCWVVDVVMLCCYGYVLLWLCYGCAVVVVEFCCWVLLLWLSVIVMFENCGCFWLLWLLLSYIQFMYTIIHPVILNIHEIIYLRNRSIKCVFIFCMKSVKTIYLGDEHLKYKMI